MHIAMTTLKVARGSRILGKKGQYHKENVFVLEMGPSVKLASAIKAVISAAFLST